MGHGDSCSYTSRALAFVAIFLLLAVNARAQHLQSFSFRGRSGVYPESGLIADAAGNLYGTATLGGPTEGGTLYQLSPPLPGDHWTITVLHYFDGFPDSTDGVHPAGGLIFDAAGNLYGVTGEGGDFSCGIRGCGTVFELSPPSAPGGDWIETTLYRFGAVADDGAYPGGGLVFDQAGNLYGATAGGGPAGLGTIFRLTPPSEPGGDWTESTLYSFSGTDGQEPVGSLVLDPGGNLYGVTYIGGDLSCQKPVGCGTVFELSPPSGAGSWTETLLHVFFHGGEGGEPAAGLMLLPSGDILGTAGVVFRLLPPSRPGEAWKYVVLHTFNSPGDGAGVVSGLTQLGNTFYGTTDVGGAADKGTVFKITAPHARGGAWTEAVVCSFDDTNGRAPFEGVTIHDGALWGTATYGGRYAAGSIFRVTP